MTDGNGHYINGWVYKTDTGTYGYDYLLRAAVAKVGLGKNLPQEAIYAKALTDSDGRQLSGANKFVMHFANGMTPPVDAFWSLTMYNATTYLLIPNDIQRYSIGDGTPGLQYNPDGSLDIYVHHESPVGNESNWLPAPDGEFYLMLRMYKPKSEVLKGTYQIPPLQKVT